MDGYLDFEAHKFTMEEDCIAQLGSTGLDCAAEAASIPPARGRVSYPTETSQDRPPAAIRYDAEARAAHISGPKKPPCPAAVALAGAVTANGSCLHTGTCPGASYQTYAANSRSAG